MHGHGRLLDRLVGACFLLLLAAVALHQAVRLVQEIWPALLLIGGVVLALAAGFAWWRSRRSRW